MTVYIYPGQGGGVRRGKYILSLISVPARAARARRRGREIGVCLGEEDPALVKAKAGRGRAPLAATVVSRSEVQVGKLDPGQVDVGKIEVDGRDFGKLRNEVGGLDP